MAPKVSDTFSWRIARAKNLLTETDIDRLACVALLCIDNMNVSPFYISCSTFSSLALLILQTTL
jgi:hypothetical protein